ncbi:MAG TPA: sugar phosphate isomerase/epimerase [Phycisphaerales bacterium]|nr:sugar phosphate isomerase/epimerase [Phycisphaerales bacterium]
MAALATIAPFGFDFDTPRLLAAYAALGCRSCQFYRNEAAPPDPATVARLASAAGLRIDSIHGVFGYDYDPSSPDPRERARCLEVYAAEARLCRHLGGSMVVVHPSAWTPQRRVLAPAEAEQVQGARWEDLDDFLRRLADVAAHAEVIFLLENQPRNCYLGHDAPRLAQHVLRIGAPGIRMCLDVGHAHITGDAAEIIRQCAPAIQYFHVHDNDGLEDSHLMPGEGTMRWDVVGQTMREAAPHAVRMLEVFYPEPRVEAILARGEFRARLPWMLGL